MFIAIVLLSPILFLHYFASTSCKRCSVNLSRLSDSES